LLNIDIRIFEYIVEGSANMPGNSSGSSFFERVMAATPGGDLLRTCLQCGTCGGSCPSGPDMDATPRKLFAMIAANMEEDVLASNTP
jgi:heterodisulfide reductase subunit C